MFQVELLALLLVVLGRVQCRVLFLEEFTDKRFRLRWFNSIDNVDKQGNTGIGYGPLTLDHDDGQGLKTEEDYRFYLLSSKMKRKYSNRNKTLVIQYQVTFPSLMECGGAYIKILGFDFEPTTFSSKTPYKIMFGPDVCGFAYEDRELKVILNYKGKYYNINQIIRYHISHIPQLFTFIIRPDNTYEVLINMSLVASGYIGKDFRMLRPQFIRDRRARAPSNWEGNEYVYDSNNLKPPPHVVQVPRIVDPEYYENSTKFILSKRSPFINNPNYMKPWHPPLIRNPKYKGKWIPPLIPNPNYNLKDNFYLQTDLGGVGIDVWQMSSGVIFDNILVTDNEKFARKHAKERWKDVVESITEAERNARPRNESMDLGNDMNDNLNQDHQEHMDDTGQVSCYNNIEALKNTIFGPTKAQLNILMKERTLRMNKMKQEMFSQLSALPKYSFYDPRYFNNPLIDPEGQNLEKILKSIDLRKITETVKFVNDNNLNNSF